MRAPLVFAVAAGVMLAGSLQAQRVAGVVRDSASGHGLPGAVVIVTSAQNAALARTLTDGEGRYSLPLAPSASQLRVLRLGYRPRTRDLSRGVTANLTLDVALFPVPTLLSAVSVLAQPSCPRADDSQAAASLWEQARSALLASVVAREARPARVTNLTYERALLPKDSQVVYQRTRSRSGQSTRPFVAARAPAEMNRTGYVETGPTGLRFDTPDAEVLLDDSFAATHCFHVSRDDKAHRGEVGLAFEPAPHRDDIVDVRGVLWLDPEAPALQSMEFRYTHLNPAAIEAGAGGTIHFATMANGVVVVRAWVVVLPALEENRETGRSAGLESGGRLRPVGRRPAPMRVAQLRETGGVLLEATWPDSIPWRAPMGTLRGLILSEDMQAPVSHAIVTLAGTTDTVVTDDTGRFVMAPVLPGRYVLQVADTSFSFALPPDTRSRVVSVIAGTPAATTFTLPSRAAALAKACPAGDAAGATAAADTSFANARQVSLLVGRVTLPSGISTRGLQLTARWQAGYMLGGNSAAIKEDGGEIEFDDAGRFVLCHVARERPVMLQLSKAYTRLADTLVLIPGDSALWVVDWHPVVTAATLSDAAPAAFRGAVRRATDGAPVAGAEVWLPALGQRTTTDSMGAFRLGELPEGATLVQIRRVGFLAERDTLTLARGQEVRRDYALNAQATLLDTVRTLANRTKYISPMLQGFEERRALGSGHFIAEDVFRANDERNLSSVILSRIPGISLVPVGQGGGAYIVSTRKPHAGPQFLSSKPCFVTVFLDGALLYDASIANGPPPPDATRFQNAELAGAEYYADGGSAPAQFNRTSSGCGTLLLWTRER